MIHCDFVCTFQGANMIIQPDESMLEAATCPQNSHKNRKGAGVARESSNRYNVHNTNNLLIKF